MREKSSSMSITMNNLRSSTELKSINNDPDFNSINTENNKEVSVFKNYNHLDLSFDDISYTVRTKIFSTERKKILSNVNGEFRAGELTAIMGPSGAGKTALMDVLAGFRTSGVTGEVRVNGSVRDLPTFRRLSAYITQFDYLHELLTVREAMHVAAELKLSTPAEEKNQRIDKILREMGLGEVRSTYTGKLSSGQKKRLAIALELINNLPIMFFDEPTSHLDIVTSKQCVELLRSLARGGRTIICTIHQPSATLFNMFDNLYVVAEGRCVYTGETMGMQPFLENLGFHCPPYHNPADFLLEVVSGDYGNHIAKLSDSVSNARLQLTDASTDATTPYMDAEIETSCRDESSVVQKKHTSDYPSSSWKQIRVLFRRNLVRISRDKTLVLTIIIAHIGVAMIVGSVFNQIGKDAARAFDNVKFIIFNMLFISFCSSNSTLISFPSEIQIMTREYFNRWYRLRTTYIAQATANLVIGSISTASYVLIVYLMSGQIMDYKRIVLFTLDGILIALINQILGLMFGISLSVKTAVLIMPYSVMPFILFSGIFKLARDTPSYLIWMFDISIYKHSYDGFMAAIYGFERPRMPCLQEYCHFTSPQLLLDAHDLKNVDYWWSMLVLFAFYIGVQFAAYAFLRWKLKSQRNN